MSNAKSLGLALRSTTNAVRELVAALHSGELPSDLSASRSRSVCWTPSFIVGRAPSSPNSVPFSALLLSKMLGNNSGNHAHGVVKVALLICELSEVGAMDEKDEEALYNGTDCLTKSLLEKILTRTRATHIEQCATQEAEQLLSASA